MEQQSLAQVARRLAELVRPMAPAVGSRVKAVPYLAIHRYVSARTELP